MANKKLFTSSKNPVVAPQTNTKNAAGGNAYDSEAKQCLSQVAATNCFNSTYYVDASANLELAKQSVAKLHNDPEFIAKVAIFSRDKNYMKDMPAFLTAVVATLDPKLFRKVFNRVIDNGKMLRNFIQIARSGQAGKVINVSSGSVRHAIQGWFNQKSPEAIFRASIGNDPSFRDILRMTHPKPNTTEKNALFGYLIGKDVEIGALPEVVQQYEAFKKNPKGPVPNVDFRFLDSMGLGESAWREIAKNAGWQMTRMNLNTFLRHGVFNDKKVTELIVKRLSNKEEVLKARAFPYQLMMAYSAAEGIPHAVSEALQDAMEIATDNVPEFAGQVYVGVDVSGSMSSPITGYRAGSSSKVRCVDAASLFAASILRKNRSAVVMPFDTRLHPNNLNGRDTVLTNATRLAKFGGGGTDCSLPLAKLNADKAKGDAVIYVSDCESWVDSNRYAHGTGMMTEWLTFKKRNPKAKLICIDLTPRSNSQVQEHKDILQVGGFSDQVFDVVASFIEHGDDKNHWVKVIEDVSLDG